MSLKWSKEPPTVTGLYLRRLIDPGYAPVDAVYLRVADNGYASWGDTPTCTCLSKKESGLHSGPLFDPGPNTTEQVLYFCVRAALCEYEWAGPIQPPEEPA